MNGANPTGPFVSRINGPTVAAGGMHSAQMYEVVQVGELGLVGEVVRLIGNRATIQVYEDTTMLKPGEPIRRTGQPLSVWLGPGLVGNIYDGIQRPLPEIAAHSGAWIRRGEPAGRRFFRAGHAAHAPLYPLFLGARHRAGQRASLPVHQLATILFRICRGRRRLVGKAVAGLERDAHRGANPSPTRRPLAANREARRAGRAAGFAEIDFVHSGNFQGRISHTERLR